MTITCKNIISKTLICLSNQLLAMEWKNSSWKSFHLYFQHEDLIDKQVKPETRPTKWKQRAAHGGSADQLRPASLGSPFGRVLPELRPLAALATQLHTQANSCTYDPDIAPVPLSLRAHREAWAAERHSAPPGAACRLRPRRHWNHPRHHRPGCTTEHSDLKLREGSQPRLGTTVSATHNYVTEITF